VPPESKKIATGPPRCAPDIVKPIVGLKERAAEAPKKLARKEWEPRTRGGGSQGHREGEAGAEYLAHNPDIDALKP
jgi:hypothetical protein